MLLEGRVSKNNFRKSLGAKVARMLYGRRWGDGPQIEKLLNLYSLIGPEYINNDHFPRGWRNNFDHALNRYTWRVGLHDPLATKLVMELNDAGIKAKFDENHDYINPYKDANRITDKDLEGIPEHGLFDFFGIGGLKPNKYLNQYKNVVKQLTAYPNYDNGTMHLRGRYENSLPDWLKKYSHPLQVDLEYHY